MEDTDRNATWMYVAAALLVVILLGLCCRPRDVNNELAQTTREAVALARDARDSDQSAVLWTGRFRLLAMVAGIGIPLVIAYLIWRREAGSEVDVTELIETLESKSLLTFESPDCNPAARQLPSSAPSRHLSDPTDGVTDCKPPL